MSIIMKEAGNGRSVGRRFPPSLSLPSYFPFNVTRGKINGAKCLFVSWPWFPNARTLSDIDGTLDFDC